MANKKIRVYELARELGLENKEALALCERLRIGVKSHSSSIEDAQADRVRRKADREGLRRPVQPEEPRRGAPAEVGALADVGPGPSDIGPRAGEPRRLVTSSPGAEHGDLAGRPPAARPTPSRESI